METRTVWKFHNFSIPQILREINIRDSRSAKIHKNEKMRASESV